MKHETIIYFDDEQKLQSKLIYNEKLTSKQPAVLVFPAFEGQSNFVMQYGERIAELGFVTLVVDMYGNSQTASTLDECFKLITPFLQDRSLVRKRALLAFQAMRQQTCVDQSRIGAIGFCFGGMCALELARSGENLQTAISLHGVLNKSTLETNTIKSKILILHGYKDPQVPPEIITSFAQEMEMAHVEDWTFTFFGNAQHSFTDPITGSFDEIKEKEMGRAYNPIVAKRSMNYVINFLEEHCK